MSIFDYPKVRIESFEQLPTPEAVDEMSDAAAEKALRRRRDDTARIDWRRGAINMTPEIERARETNEVRDYLQHLSSLPLKVVTPDELLPDFPMDKLFKRAYPVPGTPVFLSIHERTERDDVNRTAVVDAMCRGPNMGSAGGPTLTILGPIAKLTYVGLLNQATDTNR